MNIKRIVLVLIIACLILSFSLSGNAAADSKELRLGIGSLGGSFAYMAMILQPELQKLLPDYAIGTVPGGDVANIKATLAKEVDEAWLCAISAELAREGKAPYVKNTDLRFVATYYNTYWQFLARKGSGIKSFEDLLGKRIGVGTKGQHQSYTFETLLDFYGLSYDKIEEAGGSVSWVGYSDGLSMLQDGTLDFYQLYQGYPWSSVMAVDSAVGVELLSLSDEAVDYMHEVASSFTKHIIPKGTYSGVDEDVTTIKLPYILVARADVPDDIVYKTCQATYEDESIWYELVKNYPTGVNLERALAGNVVPIHPGAEKYYKEKGLIK